MTAKQAAERLNVSDARIRRLCREGRFPGAKRFGRDWLIPTEAVESFKRLGARGKQLP